MRSLTKGYGFSVIIKCQWTSGFHFQIALFEEFKAWIENFSTFPHPRLTLLYCCQRHCWKDSISNMATASSQQLFLFL